MEFSEDLEKELVLNIQRWLVILALLVAVSWASAKNIPFERLDIPDGLPTRQVFDVHQDERGYIWLATGYGLCRFNGRELRIFTTQDGLPDNDILGLIPGRNGRIWLQTYNGFPVYLLGDSIVKPVHRPAFGESPPPFFTTFIQDLSFGYTLYGAGDMYLLREGHSLQNFELFGNTVTSHLVMVDGSAQGFDLLFGAIVLHTDLQGRPGNWALNPVVFRRGRTRWLRRKSGELLVSNGNDVFLFDGKTWAPWSRDLPGAVIALYESPAEEVWVGTRAGAYRLLPDGRIQETFLPENGVSGIMYDRTGRLWMTTLNAGVFHTTQPGAALVTSEVRPGALYAMLPSADGMYVTGHGGALYRYREGALELLVDSIIASSDGENRITRLLVDSAGHLLGGGDPGVFFRRDDQVSYLRLQALKDIAQGPHGDYLLGHSWGAFLIPEDSLLSILAEIPMGVPIPPTRMEHFRIIPQRINAVAFDPEGDAYLATSRGLFRTISDTSGRMADVPPANVFDLERDAEGRIWGSVAGRGLFWLENQSPNWIETPSFLANFPVLRLFAGHENEMWGTNRQGLIHFKYTAEGVKTRFWGTNLGMAPHLVRDVVADSDTVFVTHQNGMTAFPRSTLFADSDRPPALHFTRVTVSDRIVPPRTPLKSTYTDNRFEFFWDAVDFHPEFRYRLRGLEDEWIATSHTSVRYRLLPPGDYQFELAVRKRSGSWSESKTIFLSVSRPWWQFAWIWLGLGAVYLGLIYVGFRYRLARIRKRTALERRTLLAEAKALRAQMNPHFIFNALNSVQQFFLRQQPEQGNRFLSKFATLIRQILENSDQQELSIEEELAVILPYLEFERLRSGDKFEFVLDIETGIDRYNTLIPGMLLQPLLENSVWHGIRHRKDRGWIRLEFTREGKRLRMEVTDNGVGRKRASEMESHSRKRHRSMGLNLLRDRIEILNAAGDFRITFRIEDLAEGGVATGTRAIIDIDYPEEQ